MIRLQRVRVIAGRPRDVMQQQTAEIGQVGKAVNEMAATTQVIAQNATSASSAAIVRIFKRLRVEHRPRPPAE